MMSEALLETLIRACGNGSELARKAVQTAYALGQFDGMMEMARLDQPAEPVPVSDDDIPF